MSNWFKDEWHKVNDLVRRAVAAKKSKDAQPDYVACRDAVLDAAGEVLTATARGLVKQRKLASSSVDDYVSRARQRIAKCLDGDTYDPCERPIEVYMGSALHEQIHAEIYHENVMKDGNGMPVGTMSAGTDESDPWGQDGLRLPGDFRDPSKWIAASESYDDGALGLSFTDVLLLDKRVAGLLLNSWRRSMPEQYAKARAMLQAPDRCYARKAAIDNAASDILGGRYVIPPSCSSSLPAVYERRALWKANSPF